MPLNYWYVRVSPAEAAAMGRDARDFWRSVEEAEAASDPAPRSFDLGPFPWLLLQCLGEPARLAPVERVVRGGGDWDVPGMEDSVHPWYADADAVRAAWAVLQDLDREDVAARFSAAHPGPQWELWAKREVRRAWASFEAAAEAGDGIVRIAG